MDELDVNAMLDNDQSLVVPHFSISSLPLIKRSQQSASSNAFVVHLDPYDPEQRLEQFCTAILDHFRERGLMQRPGPNRPHPRDKLTLHATLINVRQRRPLRDPRQRGSAQPPAVKDNFEDSVRENFKPINVTPILEAFAFWKWAENISLNRVALCEMGCEYEWDEQGEFVDGRYVEVMTRRI